MNTKTGKIFCGSKSLSETSRAKRLFYVTTAGGTFVPMEFGFGYVEALARVFYGIQDVRLIRAAGLDIDGADEEQILQKAMAEISWDS